MWPDQRSGLVTMSVPAEDVGQLLHALSRPAAGVELALVLACAAAAWLLVRVLRGAAPHGEDSIWFGRRILDGVFFPVLLLLLALLVRWALNALGQPVVLFKVMVPLLVALVVMRLTARVLHRAFPTSAFMRVVERSVSWLAWMAMVLWITGLLPLILKELDGITWKIGSSHVTVRSLIEGAVTAVLVLVLTLWLSAALESRLLKGATDNLSISKMAANALRVVLLLVGLMFALSAAGIDLTALGVMGGALGVGIGLGLQKLAANYVSGFVILAERSMNIGDVVKVDGFEGRISDISTRYTMIRALNGRESIVPNEMMITQRVENASLTDPKVAVTTVLQVAYGTDLDALMPRMLEVVSAVPRVIADPAPGVLLTNFAADGLELTVGFWIEDPEKGVNGPRSAVNLALLKLLNGMGVEIPFPQRVVRQAAG